MTPTTATFVQADAAKLPFADGTFDLTFTSPPYLAARTYGIGAQRDCRQWVDWMLDVVAECCRVTTGLVLVNCAGTTKDWRYNPGPEGLLWRWWERGGECWRPVYWNRVGIPGSGGKQWLRADVEYVLAFKSRPGKLDWSDNTANGHPPKWAPGGEMSSRLTDGRRVNQWGGSYDPESATNAKDANGKPTKKFRSSHAYKNAFGVQTDRPVGTRATGLKSDDETYRAVDLNNRLERGNEKGGTCSTPVLANPGNCINNIIVGGGVMGHPLAHENEAPFPQPLPEWFIKSHCPPGGRVLDPFSGSGTTVAAARALGRIGIGCDLRFSQCQLGTRRIATPVVRKVKGAKRAKPIVTDDAPSLFAEAV